MMRLQRQNIILEPDQDISSQDSEDDFKDFSDAFYLFKEEFDTLVDDESTSISDPQYMKLFQGVLERDALDP